MSESDSEFIVEKVIGKKTGKNGRQKQKSIVCTTYLFYLFNRVYVIEGDLMR